MPTPVIAKATSTAPHQGSPRLDATTARSANGTLRAGWIVMLTSLTLPAPSG